MDIHGFFILLEDSGLSRWVRESPSLLAFPTIIALHAIGMGLLVGANAAMDFRILGFASGIPISSLERLVPVMRSGFWLNAISGLLLLLAYPTKALTNPVFYTKIFLITCAMVDAFLIRKEILQRFNVDDVLVSNRGKVLAIASLFMWAGAVVAGRLLAYTCLIIDASFEKC